MGNSAMEAKPEDFFFSGLNIPRNTENNVGSNVTLVNVDRIPGLNTLGISLARLDYVPRGSLNPPHIHLRATEILTVLEGTLYVGFVTQTRAAFSQRSCTLEMSEFPISLIHFQLNISKTSAVAVSGLNSQNPGVITKADAVCGSNPPINPQVLTEAFQLDEKVVQRLQELFGKINQRRVYQCQVSMDH